MKYQIKIYYVTGDSFKTWDEESFLDGTWKNTEIIKENLKRIREHNLWYKKKQHYPFKSEPKPFWNTSSYDESITLKLDDGTEYMQSTFWCGYFEHLKGVEAVMCNENDLKFWV